MINIAYFTSMKGILNVKRRGEGGTSAFDLLNLTSEH